MWFTHKSSIVRGFVYWDNNILIMEVIQLFCNIFVFAQTPLIRQQSLLTFDFQIDCIEF
jgi:hypothetical protein